MAEKPNPGIEKCGTESEEGCQSSDSGRDSPTDLRLRLDLHAGPESDDSSETDDRHGLVTSSATSVESVVHNQEQQLLQHSLGGASAEGLSQHTASSQQPGITQHTLSDSESAVCAVHCRGARGGEPELTQYGFSSDFTETESQRLSLRDNGTRSSDNGAQAAGIVETRYGESKGTHADDGGLAGATSLSQHAFASTDPSSVEIPRLDLGCSDDEGAADLGLPYSDGEFTNRTTDRQITERMEGFMDSLTPESQITSVAGDLSGHALTRAIAELEEEEHLHEAIEQVSSEFVAGQTSYLRHSMVDTDESENSEEEVKKPSVYHICEPWSDQEVPDAWSTGSSKEVTPREVKKAAENFKSILMDEAPKTPGVQRFSVLTGSPSARTEISVNSTKTPGPSKPLDASTPFCKELSAVKSRDAVREAAKSVSDEPDLDRTLVEEEFGDVRSPVREFRTPPRSSPERFTVRKSPSAVRLSASAVRLSSSEECLSPLSGPVSTTNARSSPRRSPLTSDRTSPSPGLYRDQKPSKREAIDIPEARLLKSPPRSRIIDAEDDHQFRELPSGIATSEDEQVASIVSRSTYKDLPLRRLPDQTLYVDRSDRSIEDSLGDTICREIEEFLSLHAQAKALRSDNEEEYSEDSVAQKVHDLLKRCEIERMLEPTVVGSGSVLSDDLSDQDSDNEDRLADRVRILMEKVAQSDQEELDDQDPDDTLAKRIRALLERTSHHQIESSPRASPRSIHELIHSISINRSADLDVHRELDDIQETWERRKSRQSPASQAESTVSVGTAQSKNSDEYTKKRLAWDYGADLEERNLPQFVASVKASDDDGPHWSRQRARSVSLSHDIDDEYRVDLPLKSTSLLRVDRSDISLNTLREERLGLAQRVFSLLQKESPQEQAYSILREAEEQEKEIARRSQSPRYNDKENRGRPSHETRLETKSLRKGEPFSQAEELLADAASSRYDASAGHMQYYGKHKNSESLETVRSDVESQLSLKTGSTRGSTMRETYTDLHRPSSPPLVGYPCQQEIRQELKESDFESRGSGKRKRGEDKTASPNNSSNITNTSLKSASGYNFSPVSNKPYLASNTAEVFLSGQLQRATERKFESTPRSPRPERIPELSFRDRSRPLLMQRLMDPNETNHDASREIAQIQKPERQDALRNDLVTLRQVMQRRDFSSSIETSQGETTMESTHTGSDDAQAPNFPSYVYGTRVNTGTAHRVGVYGNRSGGEFLIYPISGESTERSELTTGRSDLSQSSTMSRKRAWVEEQMEEVQETPRHLDSIEESIKENQPQYAFPNPRREPRRSLQILQEILERESDSDAVELDNVWARYQLRKRTWPQRSENVLRLLRSLADERKHDDNLAASDEPKTRSTLSAYSSIKTEGSWKVDVNSWKFVERNSDLRLSRYEKLSGEELTQSAPAALNPEEESPRSDKTVSTANTDDELRERMATLLEQTDSLTSIPEDKILDSGRQDDMFQDWPVPKDPYLAKIHMKIRLQREKYLKERRREHKRKEKIDKLERILDAKTRGQELTESSSASTQSSTATMTSNISDISSTVDSSREKTVCPHELRDSDNSYCPCKYGAKIESPPRAKLKPKVKAVPADKPEPVYMEFAKPTTQEQRPLVQRKKKKDRAIQTKKVVKNERIENEEKLDLSTELKIKLVSEGTQTSPGLVKDEKTKKKGKKTAVDRQNKIDEKQILKSMENCEERPESRSTKTEDILMERRKNKPAPRGNSGGMCWFIPLREPNAPTSQRSAEFVAQHRNRGPYFKENLNPEDVVPGAEFCLKKNENSNDKRISLQDAFAMFKQKFISRCRQRQKRVRLLANQKRMDLAHQKQREALFSLRRHVHANPDAHPLSDLWYKPQKRYFTKQEMKHLTQKVYSRLPEVVREAEAKKREAEYRNNRMRAEIYKRKQLSRVLMKT